MPLRALVAAQKPTECGEGLQIAVAGKQDRREYFSGLPQKICFAKILREEERPAVKRVKVRKRAFTAKRLCRDESGERSSKTCRYVRSGIIGVYAIHSRQIIPVLFHLRGLLYVGRIVERLQSRFLFAGEFRRYLNDRLYI